MAPDVVQHAGNQRQVAKEDPAHALQGVGDASVLLAVAAGVAAGAVVVAAVAVAVAVVVATLDVAIALDGEHRETPGQGVGEVVEGLSTQLGEVDGAVAVGPHDVVVACELDVLAICLPASLLNGDQVVEVRAEADGRGGRQAGDAVDDGVCGGHLRGFFGFGFGKVVV